MVSAAFLFSDQDNTFLSSFRKSEKSYMLYFPFAKIEFYPTMMTSASEELQKCENVHKLLVKTKV